MTSGVVTARQTRTRAHPNSFLRSPPFSHDTIVIVVDGGPERIGEGDLFIETAVQVSVGSRYTSPHAPAGLDSRRVGRRRRRRRWLRRLDGQLARERVHRIGVRSLAHSLALSRMSSSSRK